MYFKALPMKRSTGEGTSTIQFSDGGFDETNNPTEKGIEEIESLHGKTGSLGAVISIGTARNPVEEGGTRIDRMAKRTVGRYTDPQRVANRVRGLKLDHYWRFDDMKGIDVELDEWKPNGSFTKHPGEKTIKKIEREFNRWALTQDAEFETCAEELVKRRRLRMRDRDLWEVYATCATFLCNHGQCRDIPFEDRTAMAHHLRTSHNLSDDHLQEAMKQALHAWRYQRYGNK
jgi:hypothetical protein